MTKVKLTLTVDRELIKEAKIESVRRNVSISQMVEGLLKSLSASWIDGLAKSLDLELKYISSEEITKNRGKGFEAGKAVREMRYGREKRLSRH